MPILTPQNPADLPAIERLLDQCFGTDRHMRPSYRLRDGVAPLDTLSFVLRAQNAVVGTIRFWPIAVGADARALLLGPLAVHPEFRGRGLAGKLIAQGLAAARRDGHRVVVAIGEAARFAPLGFVPAAAWGLAMPVSVDEGRFLVSALVAGALDGVTGVLAPAPAPVECAAMPAIAAR